MSPSFAWPFLPSSPFHPYQDSNDTAPSPPHNHTALPSALSRSISHDTSLTLMSQASPSPAAPSCKLSFENPNMGTGHSPIFTPESSNDIQQGQNDGVLAPVKNTLIIIRASCSAGNLNAVSGFGDGLTFVSFFFQCGLPPFLQPHTHLLIHIDTHSFHGPMA